MTDKLSITDADSEFNLEPTKNDYLTELIKVGMKTFGEVVDKVLEIAPIGSILTELITTTIPARRIENVCTMLEIFGMRIKHLEEEILEQKMKTEEFQDIFQDSVNQSARAVSNDRLEYIASILANSLTIEELKHDEEKKLLALLNELNDTEIIWLKYYDLQPSEVDAYEEKHKEIFLAEDAPFDASELEFATETLTKEYIQTLRNRRLLDQKNQVTNLGRLFLHYIGLKTTLQ